MIVSKNSLVLSLLLFITTGFDLNSKNLTAKSCVGLKLVEIVKINSKIKLDIKYSTTNNFTGKTVYSSNRCFLIKEVAIALNKVEKDLEKQGLGLKVWDGYRPLSVQKIFWSICPNENYVANPAKGSNHNRGTAVDLTLVDLKTGKELVMPSMFDDFSSKASRNYSKMSAVVSKNCRVLESLMVKHGFHAPYSEWWHFDYKNWKNYPVLDFDIKNS